MPDRHFNVRFFDIVFAVSRALDLLSTAFSDHHLRVAYVASRVADELGMSLEEKRDVAVAGALHDVGAMSLLVRNSLQNYALADYREGGGQIPEDIHRHAHDGYQLLHGFPPFAQAARAVRFHHVRWNFGRGGVFENEEVPLASHVLHLADRASVLPDSTRPILEQQDAILDTIMHGKGKLYRPDLVEAFRAASARESFWLDLVSGYKEEIIRRDFGGQNVRLSALELYELARLFSRIIDCRSPFTASHSGVVAHASEMLAELIGLPLPEKKVLGVAGYLHDLGKLAVPSEILNKRAGLTPSELLVIKQHPYYTHCILSMVPGLEDVCTYGALHHERLDGNGYPFRARRLPLGSRVIAVADVFSALAENRPYRPGMRWKDSLAALDRMVDSGAIDGEIVALIRGNPDLFGALMSNP